MACPQHTVRSRCHWRSPWHLHVQWRMSALPFQCRVWQTCWRKIAPLPPTPTPTLRPPSVPELVNQGNLPPPAPHPLPTPAFGTRAVESKTSPPPFFWYQSWRFKENSPPTPTLWFQELVNQGKHVYQKKKLLFLNHFEKQKKKKRKNCLIAQCAKQIFIYFLEKEEHIISVKADQPGKASPPPPSTYTSPPPPFPPPHQKKKKKKKNTNPNC